MKALTLNSKIWIAVAILHIVLMLFISSSLNTIKPPQKKLVVVTRKFIPKVIAEETRYKIEKPNPLPKKIIPLKKSIPVQKQKPQQKSPKQVLKKIDQRLAKPKLAPAKFVPQKIVAPELPSYVDTACQVFKEALLLPEKGQVKLTVSVSQFGKIETMEIETYESKKNLEYLVTILPTLLLPIPEKGKETTFTVLFCND